MSKTNRFWSMSTVRLIAIVAVFLVLIATLVFLVVRIQQLQSNRSHPALIWYNELVAATQKAKQDYAREHNTGPTLNQAQLKEITDQFDYPRDDAGHFLYLGDRAVRINPNVYALPDLVPAQTEPTDRCERRIVKIHAAVKAYARAHGIPEAATLTIKQRREIAVSLDLPRNAQGEFVCPGGELIEINPIVNQRPSRVRRLMLKTKGGAP